MLRPLACALLLICLSLPAPADAGDEQSRPNILFAFADDWGRYAGAYGELEPGGINDLVSTPHFDRVAREGVLFTNAFVNAPSCTPCRSSLLSGQHFWRTGRGAILQGAVWDGSVPSYPLILQEAGYHIGHTAKVWSPGTPANAPYGAQQTAYNRRGSQFNQFSQFVSSRDDIDAAKHELYEKVRGNFDDFLADRGEGEPFCYWFGPTNCHRKWIAGSGKALWGIDPEKLEGRLPPFLPDVPVIREDIADYLGEVQAFDAMLGVLLARLEEIGELENTVVVVSGDHGMPGMPRGKCNLYDFGVAVPLALRWGAKVPGGRVVEDFVCLPDLAPTFLEAAGLTPPDEMTARSLVSVLTSERSGQVDPSRDHVLVGRERHVAGARHEHRPYPQRAIRTAEHLLIRNFEPDRWPMGTGPGHGKPAGPLPSYEQLREETFVAYGDWDASPTKAWLLTNADEPGMQKYIDYAVGRRPEWELYDLSRDPHCLTNVAKEAKYVEVRERLAEQLMSNLRATGDPRVTADPVPFEHSPFTDPPPPRRRPNRR
jgi:N-sulfoglucosamine sulfohydrolase